MRAGLLSLVLLIALGHAPAAAAWAQNGPFDSFAATEPPSTEKSPLSPPGVPAAETAAAGEPKLSPGPPVEASQLDTFWLRDSKGNLVPILGMTFEEFEQLLRLKKGLTPPPGPKFTLDALSLSGAVDDQIATLQVTATIRVREEGWVRVPLEMPSATVSQSPKYEGQGEHFLTFDPAANKYVAWIKGNAAAPNILTLHIAVNLSISGDERRLLLNLPRATESSLRLTLPKAQVEAALRGGDGIVSVHKVGNDRSEITVTGPAGELQLAWHDVREPVAEGPALLDANGTILVRVESEHRITSDAHLRVRSYGGPLEIFQVRLPPGMELVPINPIGYTLAPLTAANESTPPAGPALGQLIEVRLDRPVTTATEVRLLATLQPDVAIAGGLMPARFEVLGAVRQRGTIDFTVEGEWQLEWTEDSSVRRLDPSADAAVSRLVARFDYFRQPSGLQLRVSPRPSRISVEPQHISHVDAGQVRIESTLKYRFRGSRAAGLEFELGDWKFDLLSPEDLFDTPHVKAGPNDRVQIPFRPGSVVPAELELKLEAHRVLTPQSERLVLTFPRPIADIIAPATVIIDVADNIELSPIPAEIIGLSPEATAVRIPFRQQPPLLYRDLGGGEPALFAAALRIRKRSTVVSARANIRVDRQQLQVEQRLEYHIAHESQRSFALLAPPELTAATGPTVLLNNETVSATPLSESIPHDSSPQRLEFTAPSAQIGTIQVTVRYASPLPQWDGQTPLPLTVPLVVPAEEENLQFTGQQVNFALTDGLEIEPDLARADEAPPPAALVHSGSPNTFASTKALAITHWVLSPVLAGRGAAINIQKAWIQSWISARVRQERIALEVTTTQETLRVRLPTGVLLASVQAAINAQSIAPHVRDPGMARIDLPSAVRGRAFVLELWYALDPPTRNLGLLRTQLRPAQIEGAAPPRRTYWQLLLPGDEHMLFPPGELEPEMAWAASSPADWPLVRRPLLDQLQLEGWIGASRQDPFPRGANEYLYGALGRLPALDLVAANRRLLVSFGSGGVLALGLLLLHVPRFRSVGVLFAIAIALAAVAVVSPDLAVLVGQWSVLGAIIALVATVWTWFGTGRMPWLGRTKSTEIFRPRDPISTHSPIARPERAAPLSTATAPAGVAAEARQ